MKILKGKWYIWFWKKKVFYGKVTGLCGWALRDKKGNRLISVTSVKDFQSWNLAADDCVRAATKKEVKEYLIFAKL